VDWSLLSVGLNPTTGIDPLSARAIPPVVELIPFLMIQIPSF
jgi:hypothetical protein